MSLFVRGSTCVAAGLVGALLACGPARAVGAGVTGIACAGSAPATERTACRSAPSARRPVRGYRAMAGAARLPFAEPIPHGPGRYVSLLILGVAY